MASDPTLTRNDCPTAESDTATDPLVLLFMNAGRDRNLLSDTLSEHYRITTTTESEAVEGPFDYCILNDTRVGQLGDMIQSIRDRPAQFLPFVRLVGPDSSRASNPALSNSGKSIVSLYLVAAGVSDIEPYIALRQLEDYIRNVTQYVSRAIDAIESLSSVGVAIELLSGPSSGGTEG